ncbi:hypothetical protein ABVT39_003499 [Epinephelus coioides]
MCERCEAVQLSSCLDDTRYRPRRSRQSSASNKREEKRRQGDKKQGVACEPEFCRPFINVSVFSGDGAFHK